MKKFNILNGTKELLIKNQKSIFTGICVLSLCLVWSFTQEVKHAAEMLKIETENKLILMNFDNLDKAYEQQSQSIEFQGMIIKKQQEQMKAAESYIRKQEDALRKLIQFLKDIEEWPPSIDEGSIA